VVHYCSAVYIQYTLPNPLGNQPQGLAVGPDGNVWFTEQIGKIGRITPTGTISEFTIPTIDSIPGSIAAGPDGNLWFTENLQNKIGRITPLAARG
jgi:virginiamycin B lyase